MRNWNWVFFWNSSTHTALPDYLWGIETDKPACLPQENIASRLPMRNWNREIQKWWKSYKKASRLPMRNWNPPTSTNLVKFPASRLPMRNWNYPERQYLHAPTSLPDYLWGIETRSWRVKTRSTSLPDYLWGIETGKMKNGVLVAGFQTTYEELKPNFQDPWVMFWGASRLPMRNWNVSSWVLSFPIELPDYLWGIETLYFRLIHEANKAASRLPMRNWN